MFLGVVCALSLLPRTFAVASREFKLCRGPSGTPPISLWRPGSWIQASCGFPAWKVHQREKFIGGVRVAMLDGVEDAGDVAQVMARQ